MSPVLDQSRHQLRRDTRFGSSWPLDLFPCDGIKMGRPLTAGGTTVPAVLVRLHSCFLVSAPLIAAAGLVLVVELDEARHRKDPPRRRDSIV